MKLMTKLLCLFLISSYLHADIMITETPSNLPKCELIFGGMELEVYHVGVYQDKVSVGLESTGDEMLSRECRVASYRMNFTDDNYYAGLALRRGMVLLVKSKRDGTLDFFEL